jgi:hypothetical protein
MTWTTISLGKTVGGGNPTSPAPALRDPIFDRQSGSVSVQSLTAEGLSAESPSSGEKRPVLRQFEVTIATTRCGTTAVVVDAENRDAALTTVRRELATGDFITPPDQCTDDVQTEIWTIRELR